MDDFAQQARIFKAFCDENRLKIISLLQGGEKCACDLIAQLELGQSTLSYHMKILCDSGIIVNRQEGKWAHYRISEEGSAAAIAYLQGLTAVNEDAGLAQAGCACGGR